VSYLKHCYGFHLQEQLNYWWINSLVANMLNILGRTPPVRVQAPITVEDVSILVRPERFAVRGAHWVTGNRDLPLRGGAEGLSVTAPRMGLHEVVVLDV
jgi:hypothetical protein